MYLLYAQKVGICFIERKIEQLIEIYLVYCLFNLPMYKYFFQKPQVMFTYVKYP